MSEIVERLQEFVEYAKTMKDEKGEAQLFCDRLFQAFGHKGLIEAGWQVDCPQASMYIWARIPEPYRELGSLEFAKQLLEKAKVCVSPGIGFGDHGDDFVRFALIENESRIRQAVRGIRAMFKADAAVAA